ncbi:MAG: hypothetical protein WD989_01355 [Candidatus Paceibacterota bacterium]
MGKLSKVSKFNALVGILASLVMFEVGFLSKDLIKAESTKDYADQVVRKCSKEKYRPSCYDEEIPKLMDKISMREAFDVARVVQDAEGDGYLYCHVLGHNLSARETAKDPSKWKEVIAKCPSGMCSNGCIHGSFQERFRVENLSDEEIDKLIPELSEVCEEKPGWKPTGLEQASCYHALGHLVMYIAGGDIDKSNKVCDVVSVKGKNDFLQMCYDGNFMQIFQPLEPEDFELVRDIAPKNKEEAMLFCGKYTGLKKSSCHQESWPLYFSEIMTPKGLIKFCGYSNDDTVQKRCYNALFYIIAAQFKLDQIKIKDFCGGLPQPKQGQCFANSASRMIETDYRLMDKALFLCNEARVYGVQDVCYKELVFYSTFNYHPDSSEFRHLCDSLPNEWKEKCYSGNNSYRP